MKQHLRLTAVLVCLSLLFLLTGCNSSQPQVSEPTSPQKLGYDISREMIPPTALEDTVFLNEETFYTPDIVGEYMLVGAYWHDYFGSDVCPVAFLRAVPANTTKIKLPTGEIPVSDWEQYQIFQDKDVIIYDLYPMFYPEKTMPEQLMEELEQTYYQTEEEYQAGKVPEDRYFNMPLNSRLTQARYLSYLWDFYQINLSELIVKVEAK